MISIREQKVEFEAIDDYENQVKIRLSSSDYGDVLLIPNTVDVANLGEYFCSAWYIRQIVRKICMY